MRFKSPHQIFPRSIQIHIDKKLTYPTIPLTSSLLLIFLIINMHQLPYELPLQSYRNPHVLAEEEY